VKLEYTVFVNSLWSWSLNHGIIKMVKLGFVVMTKLQHHWLSDKRFVFIL